MILVRLIGEQNYFIPSIRSASLASTEQFHNKMNFLNKEAKSNYQFWRSPTSVAAKIQGGIHLLQLENQLPFGSQIFRPKSDTDAISLRKEGNNFFSKEQNYVSALKYYNKSICFAQKDSESLAIGYANRSAIYLNSGFYKYCLENIELALASKYPDKMRPKLETRKKECLKLMDCNDDGLKRFATDPMKLSYPESKMFDGMVEGLEIVGSRIRATKDLYPGDLVIIKKPFFITVEQHGEYSHCGYCFKENSLNLLPCNECTRAMYCSENCRQEAWMRFHKYECKIIDGIYSLYNYDDNFILGFRSTLYAFTMFDDPEDLRALLDWKIDAKLPEHHNFRGIYKNANEKHLSMDQIVKHLEKCTTAWYLLGQYTNFLEAILKTENMENFFVETLYQMGLNHSYYPAHSFRSDETEICGGLFYATCLLRHSCAANVKQFQNEGTIDVIVKRLIRKGEELFESHAGINHLVLDRGTRRGMLQKHLHCDCRCEACLNDYPTVKNLTINNGDEIELVRKMYDDIKNHLRANDRNYAKELFNKCKKALESFGFGDLCMEKIQWQMYLMESFRVWALPQELENQLKPLKT